MWGILPSLLILLTGIFWRNTIAATRDDSFDIRIFELLPNCLKMAIIVNSSGPLKHYLSQWRILLS